MNTKLYKLVLSLAFILQGTNINSCYSSDNNDIRSIAAENGNCFIEKSCNTISMNQNNQNEYNNKEFKYKPYDIDSSNCITQLINDVKNEYNNYDSDSDNEITRFGNIVNNITSDKYNDERQLNYYKELIQNNTTENTNVKIINNDELLNIIDVKPDVDFNFNTIMDEQKLSLDFKSQINAIVGMETYKIKTYTIESYTGPDLKDLNNIDFYKLIEVNDNTNLYAGNKTCCDCLVNIFKKATSYIKNVFSSSTNTSDNNITEKLINNDIEDNNYDADISSSENSESNLSINDKKKVL